MKRLLIRKLFSNKTILHHGLVFALIFWAFALVPLWGALNIFLIQSDEKMQVSRRAAIQRLLLENFEQSSRFGDLVNARGQAIQLGDSLGLKDLGICLRGKDILPRPVEARCTKVGATLVPARINDIEYVLEFDWEPLSVSIADTFLKSLFISALVSLVIITSTVFFLSRRLSALLKNIAAQIIHENAFKHPDGLNSEVAELKPIIESLFVARQRLTDSLEKNAQLRTAAALGSLAVQVAHDIRSPLTALEVIAADSGLSPDAHNVMHLALARIQGIANDLLQRDRDTLSPESESEAEQLVVKDLRRSSLNAIIESIFEEKTSQYRDLTEKKIVNDASAKEEVFALIDPSVLSRVLSNIIDNSFDAIEGRGTIRVNLSTSEKIVKIEVSDDGKGIPESRMPLLMRKGATFDKVNGTGRGLYFAKMAVEALQGTISIESVEGKGTKIIICFPALGKENTARIKQEVFSKKEIIFIDDEELNREAWLIAARTKKIKLYCYADADAFLQGFPVPKFDLLIFIDLNLKDGRSGLSEAKRLFQLGYKEIYIATGNSSKEVLSSYPYIKGVFGKSPPWLEQ